jgi:hypothetical protein
VVVNDGHLRDRPDVALEVMADARALGFFRPLVDTREPSGHVVRLTRSGRTREGQVTHARASSSPHFTVGGKLRWCEGSGAESPVQVDVRHPLAVDRNIQMT